MVGQSFLIFQFTRGVRILGQQCLVPGSSCGFTKWCTPSPARAGAPQPGGGVRARATSSRLASSWPADGVRVHSRPRPARGICLKLGLARARARLRRRDAPPGAPEPSSCLKLVHQLGCGAPGDVARALLKLGLSFQVLRGGAYFCVPWVSNPGQKCGK
ncbi:UNVERIFIED_CONTAM: hypothetical protein Sindi_2682300 [Sesamum indicum]